MNIEEIRVDCSLIRCSLETPGTYNDEALYVLNALEEEMINMKAGAGKKKANEMKADITYFELVISQLFCAIGGMLIGFAMRM